MGGEASNNHSHPRGLSYLPSYQDLCSKDPRLARLTSIIDHRKRTEFRDTTARVLQFRSDIPFF